MNMFIITTNNIPGRNFKPLGMVEGSIVQTKHIGKDFLAGLKTLVGGEITDYTQMMNEARSIAKQRMTAQAEKLGADAIIGVRYASSEVMQGAAEVIAYGTAVQFI